MYYSLKNIEKTNDISVRFWTSFINYVEILKDKDYLESYCEGDSYQNWINSDSINKKMAFELGMSFYPFQDNIASEYKLDLIEFFFKIVDVPYMSTESIGEIRYKYTVEINQMFERFRINYRLEKGQIKALHSEVLNNCIIDDFVCEDKESKGLIDLALNKFYSKDISEQRIGLNKLVDAFQRISTLDGKNKAKNIKEICDKTGTASTLILEDVKKMLRIANEDFMIRHAEVGKTKIESPIVLEYLFYLYYNAIRSILKIRKI